MRTVGIIAAILFVCIYIVSRIDLLPDVFPVLGWLDDSFLLGLLIYYLRWKKLPGFVSRLGRRLFSRDAGSYRSYYRSSGYEKGQQKSSNRGEGGAEEARDPCSVLGVKPGASREEIQAAYREAVKKYHPDRVSHLGREFQEMAQQKFVEIQEAYDRLMKE